MFVFSIFIISLIWSYLITRLTIIVFKRLGWVEDPRLKNRKTGNATALYPVPRGGGIPIFVSLFIVSLVMLPLDRQLAAILFSAFLALAIGLLDDIFDISPFARLFVNFVCALIIILGGIRIFHLSNPFFGGVLDFSSGFIGQAISIIASIIWIMWCMNSVGWSAGVEGQLPLMVSISSLFIGLLGLRFSQDLTQWPVIILATIISGAFAGFLPLNFYPQKIMPGYSGKSLSGLLLAILSILSGAKLATLIYLLAIPMLDAVFVIFYRLYHHRSPFFSDSSHLHHRLLKMGWSRRLISIFYASLSTIFGFVSLYLDSQQKIYGLLIILLVFLALTLWTFQRTSR
jgi:UDP-GlcNAc:undecaprenyl-phosphate GlcNAc-1-phosphate transferase